MLVGNGYVREIGVRSGTKIGTGKSNELSSKNPVFTTGKDNIARLKQ